MINQQLLCQYLKITPVSMEADYLKSAKTKEGSRKILPSEHGY